MGKSAIIIGAGIGGLTTAIHLGMKGFDVKIYEKNSYPGGRCGQLEKEGHRFDIGATLLMMTDIYEKTWQSFGKDIFEELELIRMDPIYQINSYRGESIQFSSDLTQMQKQLEAVESGSYEKFLAYMHESFQSYKLSMKHIIDRNYNNALQFFNLKNLLLLFKLKAFNNHYSHASKYFKSELLRVVFTFQNIYVGQNPFEASAIFSMLPFLELTDGVWYPKGGMNQIVQNLISIANGYQVSIEYDKPVQKIVTSGNRATGVLFDDGSIEKADVIIANADLPYVYDSLLPDKPAAKKISKLDYTCSAFIFHFGMDKIYPQLEQHNVFVSDDYSENIQTVFKSDELPEDVSFYVHASSRNDAESAPEDHDSVSIIVPVGKINKKVSQDWVALRNAARESFIRRLEKEGLEDFEKHIKFEVCYNPGTWESLFNISYGSVFGSLNHKLMQMGYMRPHNQHKKYKNLFFVGGSTHPGNGIPMVLLSAKLTTEKVLEFIKK